MRKYLAEFFGTMFLVLLACGSAVLAGPKIGTLGIGLCFGLVLLALVYAIGKISGCHVNPAVSFAVYLSDSKFSGKDFCCYVVAQVLGAAVGAAFLYWLMEFQDFGQLPYLMTNQPVPDSVYQFGGITDGVGTTDRISYLATNVLQTNVNWATALLTEFLLTFFFVFIVLGSTSKWGVTALAGVAIGLALGLSNIVGIPIDNCSVNPARSLGPCLFAGSTAWPDIWIMIVGPMLGAAFAAFCWKGISQGVVPEEVGTNHENID